MKEYDSFLEAQDAMGFKNIESELRKEIARLKEYITELQKERAELNADIAGLKQQRTQNNFKERVIVMLTSIKFGTYINKQEMIDDAIKEIEAMED